MLDQWRSERRWDCSGASARSSDCAPGCSTGSTRTLLSLEAERGTSSTARQEDTAPTRRHDATERAHHASDQRPVPQRGDDQEPRAESQQKHTTIIISHCALLLSHVSVVSCVVSLCCLTCPLSLFCVSCPGSQTVTRRFLFFFLDDGLKKSVDTR